MPPTSERTRDLGFHSSFGYRARRSGFGHGYAAGATKRSPLCGLSPRRLMKTLDLDPASDDSYNDPMQEEPQHYPAILVD
jgi:hypothetical protein